MNLANTIMAILTQHQLNKNTKLQMVLCKEHIAMLMPMELCKRQIILLMVMDSVLPQPIYHKHQSPQLEEAINSKGFDYRYISKIFFYKIWALKKQNKCKHIKSLLQVSSNVLSFKKSDLHILRRVSRLWKVLLITNLFSSDQYLLLDLNFAAIYTYLDLP